MLFSTPIPFREALQRQQVKSILPTVLSSAELSGVSPELLERAMFSARVYNAELLQGIKNRIDGILRGTPTEGRDAAGTFRPELLQPGQVPQVTMDRSLARVELKEILRDIGYQPTDARDVGTIKDLRTDARLNLILDTNTQMAQGYGWWAQGQDEVVLDEWPCQELIRISDRVERRNWYSRWTAAGGRIYAGSPRGLPLTNGVGVGGRCIARKDDPIWGAISRFGTPYPPFDFNSGIDVRDVSRAEAMDLGIIDRDTRVEPQTRGFNTDLQATPDVRSADLRAALESEGYKFDGDVLVGKAS